MEGVRRSETFGGMVNFLAMLCLRVRTIPCDSRHSEGSLRIGLGWDLPLLMARAAAADPQAARATNPLSSGGEGGATLARGTPICFRSVGANPRPFMRTFGIFGAFRGVVSRGNGGCTALASAREASARARSEQMRIYENRWWCLACPFVT